MSQSLVLTKVLTKQEDYWIGAPQKPQRLQTSELAKKKKSLRLKKQMVLEGRTLNCVAQASRSTSWMISTEK